MVSRSSLIVVTAILLLLPCCADRSIWSPSCHDFVEIEFEGEPLCVSPDYYEVDGIRTPVGMAQALEIARENFAFLPTPDMVDAIWEQADLHLEPIPMTPGPMMTSEEYYVRHDQMIDEQIGDQEFTLVAGHKKDIVQPEREGRVTIYGWHRLNGDPIQPVSSVHGAEYRDYSHGLRLVRYPM